jgi:RNA ligase (TIGR02306 family)
MAGMVFVGKVIGLDKIEGADLICCATVVCGPGGKWRGVVRKAEFDIGTMCDVFLPDALIPENLHNEFAFLESSRFIVKMRRFKGSPSEVVILRQQSQGEIGDDVSHYYGVTKYEKPVPANLAGYAAGNFPPFIPKTDEPNWQTCSQMIGKWTEPVIVTLKCDGSSTTAFKLNGELRVCSRNLELQHAKQNGYWAMAIKHGLEEKLPEGIALQWETCGPGIQKNPMGLSEISAFAFGAYNITERRYCTFEEFTTLCTQMDFPTAPLISRLETLQGVDVESLGRLRYDNGKPAEGVVLRNETYSKHMKVINLDFK